MEVIEFTGYIEEEKIEIAIAIEVGHRNGSGAIACREGLCGLEGPVSVAEQHRHVVAGEIGRDKVGDRVPIEVGHGDGTGAIACRELLTRK